MNFFIHNLNKEIYKMASLKKLSLDKFSSQAQKIFKIKNIITMINIFIRF